MFESQLWSKFVYQQQVIMAMTSCALTVSNEQVPYSRPCQVKDGPDFMTRGRISESPF